MMQRNHLTVDTSPTLFTASTTSVNFSLDDITNVYPAAKLKSDDLFFAWLSTPANLNYVKNLVIEYQQGTLDRTTCVKGASSSPHVASPSTSGRRSPLSSPPLSPKRPSASPGTSPKRYGFSHDAAFSGKSPTANKRIESANSVIDQIQPLRSPIVPRNILAGDENDAYLENRQANLLLSPSSTAKPRKKATPNKPSRVAIPPFYVPNQGGRGRGAPCLEDTLQKRRVEIEEYFASFRDGVSLNDFIPFCKDLCGFPVFFNALVFRRIRLLNAGDAKHAQGEEKQDRETKAPDGGRESKREEKSPDSATKSLRDDLFAKSKPIARSRSLSEHDESNMEEFAQLEDGVIRLNEFLQFWKQEIEPYDLVDRMFRLLKDVDRDYVVSEDFLPLMGELLAYHPGLEFLENTPEFQEKYARTVIARIMYTVNTSCTGQITAREFRRSNLAKTCQVVDEEEDINNVMDFFSYQHFYVLYCKFWELDADHDFLLSKEDLVKHGGHSLTSRIVDRVFQQIPRKFSSQVPGKMGYEDFITFFLSEEDKANRISLRYWFDCVDLDGDGVIRRWEMEHFFSEQLRRVRCLGHEEVSFENILCQLHDCICPKTEGQFVLSDFLHPSRIKLSGVFFNVLFNLNKFLAFEQRDPFAQAAGAKLSDWDRYAAVEYAHLAGLEQQDEMSDDDYFEDDEDDERGEWGTLNTSSMSAESPF